MKANNLVGLIDIDAESLERAASCIEKELRSIKRLKKASWLSGNGLQWQRYKSQVVQLSYTLADLRQRAKYIATNL